MVRVEQDSNFDCKLNVAKKSQKIATFSVEIGRPVLLEML